MSIAPTPIICKVTEVHDWEGHGGKIASALCNNDIRAVIHFPEDVAPPRLNRSVDMDVLIGKHWYTAVKWSYIEASRYRGEGDEELEHSARVIAKQLGEFTADDLHVLEEMIAEKGRDRRVIGSVLTSLKRKGLIEEVGYVRSTREKCHGRPVLRWKWVGKE